MSTEARKRKLALLSAALRVARRAHAVAIAVSIGMACANGPSPCATAAPTFNLTTDERYIRRRTATASTCGAIATAPRHASRCPVRSCA